MEFMALVRAEMLKLRHTPHWVLHILIPLAGTCLFVFYFTTYIHVAPWRRTKLMLELTVMVFPLLIAVIVGLNVMQEEREAQFQMLLAVHNRVGVFLAKLMVLYLSGELALVGLYILFAVGVSVFGDASLLWRELLQVIPGVALWSFTLYVLHFFLSLKFGLGISLFWGVFECLQCIMYSNITLQGVWRYIPFAWSMNWLGDVFDGKLLQHGKEWLVIGGLQLGFLALTLVWVSRWEGRKSYE